MSEPIHSYYDVLISNTNNYAIPAEFNETQTIPYLDHAEDYEMTIVRFKCPLYNVPLFTFPNDDLEDPTVPSSLYKFKLTISLLDAGNNNAVIATSGLTHSCLE